MKLNQGFHLSCSSYFYKLPKYSLLLLWLIPPIGVVLAYKNQHIPNLAKVLLLPLGAAWAMIFIAIAVESAILLVGLLIPLLLFTKWSWVKKAQVIVLAILLWLGIATVTGAMFICGV